MDIAYKPREDDDQNISDVLSKIAMFLTDQNKFPWKESQVFSDGLIQQRGYFNIKMDFNENVYGDVKIDVLDPLDVIPDPDSKSYDPDDWADVMLLSWMTLDDIKETYGEKVYRKIGSQYEAYGQPDYGRGSFEEDRNKFGSQNSHAPYFADVTDIPHVRLIDRQYWKIQNREFYFNTQTGDTYPVPEGTKPSEVKRYAKTNGLEVIKKVVKRIRWTVTSHDCILFDDWSPYDHFTVVPYFPYFRRGVTLGLVDNLIKTQERINKVSSQILHSVNSTSNSGWLIEENSLSNMDVEDLDDIGAQTGLVLEYKSGRQKPEKIEPNQVPTGLSELYRSGIELIRLISGVSETFQGGKGPEVSGVAIQSRSHQAAIQLAAPIDNLFRTRNMIAERLLKLIQTFLTQERTYMISGTNPEGISKLTPVTINKQAQDTVGLINDVTIGKYDVVVADVPTQITFQNAQFSQAIEMKKYGVNIPDDEMVLMSTLSRKHEIAKKISPEPTEEQRALQQRSTEAELSKLEATSEDLEAKAKEKAAETLSKVASVAQMISDNPSLAILIDSLLETLTKEQEEKEPQQVPSPVQSEQLGQPIQ
jgi:regulator of replication initiation timing